MSLALGKCFPEPFFIAHVNISLKHEWLRGLDYRLIFTSNLLVHINLFQQRQEFSFFGYTRLCFTIIRQLQQLKLIAFTG